MSNPIGQNQLINQSISLYNWVLLTYTLMQPNPVDTTSLGAQADLVTLEIYTGIYPSCSQHCAIYGYFWQV